MKLEGKTLLVLIVVSIFCLSLCAGCNQQPKSDVPPASVKNDVVEKSKVLAAISGDEKPHQPQHFQVIFNEFGKGVAYVTASDGNYRIVHNGNTGRLVTGYDVIALSPDGQRIAYGALVDGSWRMVIDDGVGVRSDEVGEPVFSPDSRHVAYTARIGDKWHLVVDGAMSPGCLSYLGKPLFSADSTKVLSVEKAGKSQDTMLIISDLSLKKQYLKINSVTHVIANEDKTSVAAVIKESKKYKMITVSFASPDAVTQGTHYDTISSPAFGANGVSLSYFAEKDGKRYFVLSGKEEILPDGTVPALPVVRPDNKGTGVIISSKEVFFLHQAFFRDGIKEKQYDEAADLVYSKDSSIHAYSARKGASWFIVVNGKEGPAFDRVVMPVFSPDNKLLIYRARKDGKRFVVVADAAGNVLRHHPAYEQVFHPVFTADGKSVAYGVKDGRNLIWKVEKLLN